MKEVTVGRQTIELWCHASATLGTAHRQVTTVNSMPLKDAVSHWANSMSPCPSSHPAHYPSPPEKEFASASKWNLGPNPILSVQPAKQRPVYNPLCERCHHQGTNQFTRSPGQDATRRSGEGSLPRRLRRHTNVQRSESCLKKVQKPVAGRDRCRSKKTWSEVIRLDCLAPGLTETHPSDGNLGVVYSVLRGVPSDWSLWT